MALFLSAENNPSTSAAAESMWVRALIAFFNPCTLMHLKHFIKINKSN